MSKLKIIKSTQMSQLVENLGFALIRQKGSHRFYRHTDGRTTVVPMHANDLDRSLIRKIISDLGLSVSPYVF